MSLTLGITSGIVSGMDGTDKVRENRLRRMAERQGLILQKCKLRDPRAIGYGTYRLLNAATGAVVMSGPGDYGLTLDHVEGVLTAE